MTIETVTAIPGYSQMAEQIRSYLLVQPTQGSVPEIAAVLGLDEDDVSYILHNYRVCPDGTLELTDGNGGGWLPLDIAAKFNSMGSAEV